MWERTSGWLCRLTKWVPVPGKMTRQVVEENVDKSRRRMDVACLDMMQFHWYVYTDVILLQFGRLTLLCRLLSCCKIEFHASSRGSWSNRQKRNPPLGVLFAKGRASTGPDVFKNVLMIESRNPGFLGRTMFIRCHNGSAQTRSLEVLELRADHSSVMQLYLIKKTFCPSFEVQSFSVHLCHVLPSSCADMRAKSLRKDSVWLAGGSTRTRATSTL